MPGEQSKQLFEILDEGVFQPVLQTGGDQVPRHKDASLPSLKNAMAELRARFDRCASDEEVYQFYHEQLASAEADRLNRELRGLDLPVLADCREQLERAANTLFDTQRQKHRPHGAPSS